MRKVIYSMFIIMLLFICCMLLISCDAITAQNITNTGPTLGMNGGQGNNDGPKMKRGGTGKNGNLGINDNPVMNITLK